MIHSLIKRPWRAGLAAFIGLAFIGAACAGSDDELRVTPETPAALQVSASMYPLEYFASRIGGELVEAKSVIRPGVDAHEFEPTPGDLRDISRANLFIYNGLGFEPWVDGLLKSGNAPAAVMRAAPDELGRGFEDDDHVQDDGDEVDEHGHEGVDPHVWLDPSLARELVANILDGIARAAPDNRRTFESNAALLESELTTLDAEFSGALSTCRTNVFVTSHEAFNYFADRYGLRAIGIAGINPLSEPSARTLANLADTLNSQNVRHVLVSPIDSDRLGKTIAREVGGETLPLHTIQNLTADERDAGANYFSLMRSNLASLLKALDCGA